MKIHREGYRILMLAAIVILLINLLIFRLTGVSEVMQVLIPAISLIIFLFMLYFFRSPERNILPEQGVIVAPADGKVVAIEEVEKSEYFGDKRLQVSIFMSPLNVHSNRYPVSGVVQYVKHHPGKYLVAWHPKSSELNECSTVVIRSSSGTDILVKQIAGAMARRIVTYAKVGTEVTQGDELGFIKFGSRVDLLLPAGSVVIPSLGDEVRANITQIVKN
ncbi:MAG: phosphatidylserine decarboxylase family protein [Bacteroidales bacterium]|nr:phosphatidylserine decarboxylase family protein [Bacteroidales bacterium]